MWSILILIEEKESERRAYWFEELHNKLITNLDKATGNEIYSVIAYYTADTIDKLITILTGINSENIVNPWLVGLQEGIIKSVATGEQVKIYFEEESSTTTMPGKVQTTDKPKNL